VELALEPDGVLNVDSFYQPYVKQDLLHSNPAKYLLAIGGNGSGKSAFLLGESLYNCLEYPGANVLLLRRDYPELEKGLILDFKNTVPKELYRYNDSKHIATFPNESKLFFGHLQNQSEKSLSQYLSSAFIFIGIDELGQFSFDAWNFLTSRNRVNSGCQANPQGLMPYCRMGGATNPLGPGYGWIKRTWIEHKPVMQLGKVERAKDGIWYAETHGARIPVYDPKDYFFVHSTVLDNPSQLAKDPDYLTKLMRLAPALRQKALYGDLNSVAGQYFSNLSYERHIRRKDQIEWQDWQPIWLGIDWGLAHHTAVFWATRAQLKVDEKTSRSIVAIYREMVINETNYQDLCHMIEKLTPKQEKARVRFIFLSPERFNRTGNTQHTVALEMSEILHELGLPRCSRANDRRVDGAVFMYNLLDAGELIITQDCPQLIESLETRIRDEDELEDVLKVEDVGDDVYDGARYTLLSMLSERGKPEELKEAEKLASIPDHTARMIYAYELMQRREEKSKPIKPKIVPGYLRRR
jgi:hypothetical protein